MLPTMLNRVGKLRKINGRKRSATPQKVTLAHSFSRRQIDILAWCVSHHIAPIILAPTATATVITAANTIAAAMRRLLASAVRWVVVICVSLDHPVTQPRRAVLRDGQASMWRYASRHRSPTAASIPKPRLIRLRINMNADLTNSRLVASCSVLRQARTVIATSSRMRFFISGLIFASPVSVSLP